MLPGGAVNGESSRGRGAEWEGEYIVGHRAWEMEWYLKGQSLTSSALYFKTLQNEVQKLPVVCKE